MPARPLKGHLYLLDLEHVDLRIVLDAKPSCRPTISSRWIHHTTRFVRARCRGEHPADSEAFIFDIEGGTPSHFSLKSDPPETNLHVTYGLVPHTRSILPSSINLRRDSGGIRQYDGHGRALL